MWHIKMDIISFSQILGKTFIIYSILFLMPHPGFYAIFRPVVVSFGQCRWWLSLMIVIAQHQIVLLLFMKYVWQQSVLVFYPFHLLAWGLAVFQTHDVSDVLSNRHFCCNKQALSVQGCIIYGIRLITYDNLVLFCKKFSPVSS